MQFAELAVHKEKFGIGINLFEEQIQRFRLIVLRNEFLDSLVHAFSQVFILCFKLVRLKVFQCYLPCSSAACLFPGAVRQSRFDKKTRVGLQLRVLSIAVFSETVVLRLTESKNAVGI